MALYKWFESKFATRQLGMVECIIIVTGTESLARIRALKNVINSLCLLLWTSVQIVHRIAMCSLTNEELKKSDTRCE